MRRGNVVVLCLVLVALAVAHIVGESALDGLSQYLQPGDLTRKLQKNRRQLDSCEALALHEGGHWEHLHSSELGNGSQSGAILNSSSVREQYLPIEIDWLAGKNWPGNTWNQEHRASRREDYQYDGDDALMYTSKMGNQLGKCGVPGFEPTLSRWVAADNTTSKIDGTAREGPASPTLRLVQRLAKAKKNMCLMGDSIDFQFSYALRHNLFRQRLLQDRINITISSRQIPVNYTNETGSPPYISWMTMQNIPETTVSLKDLEDDGGTTHFTTIRYFLAYGWSPWNALFMEDCDVVVLNLGLHYDARNERMSGTHWGQPKFKDDFRAALTFLVDFVAQRRDRIAIWRSVFLFYLNFHLWCSRVSVSSSSRARSTLPQHFDTVDGHHERGVNCSLSPRKLPNSTVIQNYNRAAEDGFATFCSAQQHDCGLAHTCTVNRTSMEYRTVYKYLVDNNCTERQERFEEGEPNVTGKILRWNIADLFDEPLWHQDNGDASHFCYIPPLYEAAFQRLELLLP